MSEQVVCPNASAVIYRDNGKLKVYCVPNPLPWDELIRRFEFDRAAEQAEGRSKECKPSDRP